MEGERSVARGRVASSGNAFAPRLPGRLRAGAVVLLSFAASLLHALLLSLGGSGFVGVGMARGAFQALQSGPCDRRQPAARRPDWGRSPRRHQRAEDFEAKVREMGPEQDGLVHPGRHSERGIPLPPFPRSDARIGEQDRAAEFAIGGHAHRSSGTGGGPRDTAAQKGQAQAARNATEADGQARAPASPR